MAEDARLSKGQLNFKILSNHRVDFKPIDVEIFAWIFQFVDLSGQLDPLVLLDPSAADALLAVLSQHIYGVVGLRGLFTSLDT